MKTKSFLLVIFAFCVTALCAQSNPNRYRNLAAMHIWTQNCEKAQICYNIYKDLAGKSLEKMDILIGKECQGKLFEQYIITYNSSALLSALERSNISDKDLIVRVLSMYSDEEERIAQLRRLAGIYLNLYEALAEGVEGEAWYNSIFIQIR